MCIAIQKTFTSEPADRPGPMTTNGTAFKWGHYHGSINDGGANEADGNTFKWGHFQGGVNDSGANEADGNTFKWGRFQVKSILRLRW